jgi:hypothetical protein
MAIEPEPRSEYIRKILNLILDVPASEEEETIEFRNILQEDLMKAMKYWIDQLKGLFAEVVEIKEIHGFNEEGVDIVIDLLNEPRIGLGIQLKTHGDIEIIETTFANKVHAQISRSHKHGLSYLILAFAGDLNNKSQKQKVAGIISDIHQNTQDNNYVTTISPEKLLTIYRAYKNHQYPLDFIKLDIENAILIGKMIGKALSNKEREASVKINIKYNNEFYQDEKAKVEFKTELNSDEYGKFDKLEHLHDMKGEVSLENIKDFKVYEKDKLIFSSPTESKILVTPEEQEFLLTIQSISDDGSIIDSLDNVPFKTTEDEGFVKSTVSDENNPCRVEFLFDPKTNRVTWKLNIEYFRGDAIKLLKACTFWNLLKDAKQLKIIELPSNKPELVSMPQDIFKEIDKNLLAIIKHLAFIQEKTGYVLRLPKDLKNKSEELNKIIFISRGIEHGKVSKGKGTSKIKLSRIHTLEILDKYIKNRKLGEIERPIGMIYEKIFDTDVCLGYGKLKLFNPKPIKDAKELYEKFVNMNDEMVDLELEFLNSEILLEWFFK